MLKFFLHYTELIFNKMCNMSLSFEHRLLYWLIWLEQALLLFVLGLKYVTDRPLKRVMNQKMVFCLSAHMQRT